MLLCFIQFSSQWKNRGYRDSWGNYLRSIRGFFTANGTHCGMHPQGHRAMGLAIPTVSNWANKRQEIISNLLSVLNPLCCPSRCPLVKEHFANWDACALSSKIHLYPTMLMVIAIAMLNCQSVIYVWFKDLTEERRRCNWNITAARELRLKPTKNLTHGEKWLDG